MEFPKKLEDKLSKRKAEQSLRTLGDSSLRIDFSSNDYLGFASNEELFHKTHAFLLECGYTQNGATGSRLLSGNHLLYKEVEKELCVYHNASAALIFNSGYDANLGLLATVPQRGDIILYDEFIHASIRDGIQLSNAKSYKFKHNDLEDLEALLKRYHEKHTEEGQEIYVISESIFSMDGDMPDLKKMTTLCSTYNARCIIDEAHAVGVLGNNGLGVVQALELENAVFARIITFGKALGAHGAVILGNEPLITYLINFARSFIYTTGLSPHALATIKIAYQELTGTEGKKSIEDLRENIRFFQQELKRLELQQSFIPSNSAIHCCMLGGNENVKAVAEKLQELGFDVKPILSPTVPKGKERLRFCIHTYNSKAEITAILEQLVTFVV